MQFAYDLVVLGQLNRAPAFTSGPDVEALAGRTYRYAATAVDPDGEALTFALVGGPAGLVVDPTSGIMTWAPTAAEVGNYDVILRTTDGRGGADELRYTLAVRDEVPNRPPVFNTPPVVDVIVGTTYTYVPMVVDEDGDALGFTLAGPTGMTIAQDTGRLTWTPAVVQIGLQTVVLTATDGQGGTATQVFQVNVLPDPTNHAPVIVSDPPTAFQVYLPGTPTGTVSPTLIALGTGETRTEHVTVVVPPATAVGNLDLLPENLDASAATTEPSTLRVSGTLSLTLRNCDTSAYSSATAGTFAVTAFEDRNGNATFDVRTDTVLGRAVFAGALAAGGTTAFAIPLSGVVQFRDRPTWVSVDSANAVPETDEANNTLATGLDSLYQPTQDWLRVVQWFSADTGSQVRSTPTLAPLIDTNGDGRINEPDVPAVLVVSAPDNSSFRLTALRGDTGQTIFSVPETPTLVPHR